MTLVVVPANSHLCDPILCLRKCTTRTALSRFALSSEACLMANAREKSRKYIAFSLDRKILIHMHILHSTIFPDIASLQSQSDGPRSREMTYTEGNNTRFVWFCRWTVPVLLEPHPFSPPAPAFPGAWSPMASSPSSSSAVKILWSESC